MRAPETLGPSSARFQLSSANLGEGDVGCLIGRRSASAMSASLLACRKDVFALEPQRAQALRSRLTHN